MRPSKNTQAVIASLVMITLAFGSFPASNEPLDTTVNQTQTAVPNKQASNRVDDQTSNINSPVKESKSSIDPDVSIEYEKQKIAYLDSLTKWKDLQQSIPNTEMELKKATMQQIEIEKNVPALPIYEEREWLSADGKHKTIATIIESDYKTGKLKKSDGSIVTVEKSKLSDVDKEVYDKQRSQWQKEKEVIAKRIEDLNKLLLESRSPEPVAPDLNAISYQVAEKKRLEKMENDKRIALQKLEEEQRKTAESDAAKRKEEEYEKKYKERFVDKNGLTLDLKSITTERDSFGITINGVVFNRNKKKLSYAQISFNLYDSSGAQVGSAFANINGLEPDGAWKFSAIGLAETASKFKFDDMSGF
jgi:hypothetical protein